MTLTTRELYILLAGVLIGAMLASVSWLTAPRPGLESFARALEETPEES